MSEQDLYLGLDRVWDLRTEFNGPKVVKDLDDQIADNYQRLMEMGRARSSSENWRWYANSDYDRAKNRSLETIVEREIIGLTQALGTWANQVPVNSGISEGNNQPSHIDLVHRTTERSFELIELKIESDDPYKAALQILRYGLTYRLFRRVPTLSRSTQHPLTKELFEASRIHLRVLAPAEYYRREKPETIEPAICEGFEHLLKDEKWKMDFAFVQFPDWFQPNSAELTELRQTLELALVGRGPLRRDSAASA
ncbi:MAG: hypothetical protein ACHQLQ_01020 [Candidatus Acidiferrales bacterium]